MNQKLKKKTFKPSLKTKLKSKPAKKSVNTSDDNKETADDDDSSLRQELNEIIKDFRKTDPKSGKKRSKLKQKSSKPSQVSDNQPKTVISNHKTFVDRKTTTDGNDSHRKSRGLKPKLMVKLETKWHEMRVFDDAVDTSSAVNHRYPHQRVQELRREAEELLAKDTALYYELQTGNTGAKGDDWHWIRTVLKNGTLADKLSAHTVLIQDSAVHNLKSLEQMVAMVSTKAKRECLLAVDTLRDLFIGDLLIPDKKLRTFGELIAFFDDKTGKKDRKSRSRQLILCLFEERLKLMYRQFLESVVAISHDSLDTTKHKSLITVFDLLVNNGEQEQYLLAQLCNKLGDPVPRVAAQCTHFLNQLINRHHPFMKPVVVDEVERVLYRPNIGSRAQYYGLCFLSEVMFASGGADQELANKLIGLYFGFFKACCKRGDINNKMMSVLLTGVSRAFPYSKLDSRLMEDHLQTFYKLIHFVNENTGIQALCLIFNILDVQQTGSLTDRFYAVLYRHLLDVQLEYCSRRAMLLNLVYRAMKRDPVLRRVKAFVKRLLQVAVTQSSSVATSILILISEVIHSKPGLVLNKEVMEQTVVTNNTGADESDDEHYEDVPLSDEEGETVADSQPSTGSDNKKASVSWVHTKNIDTNRPKSSYYDPSARNPLFACAETTALWELDVMGRHFHPSTQMFAQKIVNNERIDYSGDPLVDFSVKQFLNRFVFRNPKKMDKRVKKSTRESRVFGRIPAPTTGDTGAVVADITSKDYVNQSESRVPVDELFIYNYLRQRQSMASAAKGDDSDAESVTSVEFESLLDRLEPMSKRERDLDFHKDFSKKSSKSKRDDDDSADEGSDGDSSADEDEFGDDSAADDEDMEFDADDPDFADAFDGIDEDLEEAFGDEDDDGSGDEDRDGAPAKRPKRNKKGFDSVTNSVFASADEFAELLEDNESDSDISGAEESAKGVGAKGKGKADRKAEFRAKRKLGRNHSKNKKRKKVNPKDLL